MTIFDRIRFLLSNKTYSISESEVIYESTFKFKN